MTYTWFITTVPVGDLLSIASLIWLAIHLWSKRQ